MLSGVIDLKKDIAVLDLGTSTICATIARVEKKESTPSPLNIENEIRVVGVGYQLAKGIKKGSITNLEDLEDSILNAIATAEKEAQKSIKSVFVALPSWAIESQVVENTIDIGQMSVDDIHLSSLFNFDTARYIDDSEEIIHIFPISYSIDDEEGIQDPIGMVGQKLSALFHVITAKKSLVKNITNCLSRNNIKIEGFISSTYTSGLSVLLPDEISSGVTLIDMGGSITSVACYYDGKLLYIGFIPIGSDNITKDVSVILRTTYSNAERLKRLYGAAALTNQNDDEQILVPRIDEYGEEHIQNVSRAMLDSIISARIEEIFELVQQNISNSGADKAIYQRIVITGGGSRISGITEMLKIKKFFPGSTIRLGKPIGTLGSHDFVQSPAFSSSAGVIRHCIKELSQNDFLVSSKRSFWQRIMTWFKRGV